MHNKTNTEDCAASAVTPQSTAYVGEKTLWIDRVPRWVAMLALFVIFIAVWQGICMLGLLSTIILPTPLETALDIVFVGWNMLNGKFMLAALWVTTQEVLLGFFLAIGIGFVLGVVVGETTFGEKAVMPYLVAINAMPKVAFAPLFIAWLGFGISSKVALAAFIAVFPIIVGTATGLNATSESERMLFNIMGATRWQRLTKLKLPTGMPHFFAGLKNAAVLTVVGAVVGEFLGGGKGFGELIRVASSQLDTPRVFSLIIYLSFLGLSVFWGVLWLQKKLVFWYKDSVSQQTLE